jgi:hypothetical protein
MSVQLTLPECGPDTFCQPYTQHTDTQIRDICLECGKIGEWIVVIAEPKGGDG